MLPATLVVHGTLARGNNGTITADHPTRNRTHRLPVTRTAHRPALLAVATDLALRARASGRRGRGRRRRSLSRSRRGSLSSSRGRRAATTARRGPAVASGGAELALDALDLVAGVGVQDVHAFRNGARVDVAKLCNEHVRVRGEASAAVLDGDDRAVNASARDGEGRRGEELSHQFM